MFRISYHRSMQNLLFSSVLHQVKTYSFYSGLTNAAATSKHRGNKPPLVYTFGAQPVVGQDRGGSLHASPPQLPLQPTPHRWAGRAAVLLHQGSHFQRGQLQGFWSHLSHWSLPSLRQPPVLSLTPSLHVSIGWEQYGNKPSKVIELDLITRIGRGDPAGKRLGRRRKLRFPPLCPPTFG